MFSIYIYGYRIINAKSFKKLNVGTQSVQVVTKLSNETLRMNKLIGPQRIGGPPAAEECI